ncbi:MAG TPA: pantoate--beta-alanine ligase [Chitinophagaceae bacterium]|nr:pantoate--beta-alanine ligase [Chitinophagaceae bacterium]
MVIFKMAKDLQDFLHSPARGGANLGFVPTMGALHEGHLSLVNQSLRENNLTVSSIFVNPAQFNDPADFQKYPVTVEEDIRLLEEAGCDVLFLPGLEEIYPGGRIPDTQYDLGSLESRLEGAYRPGHFQGVCKVVHRLLDLVDPTRLYLGLKDYQQCMVIARLVRLLGREPGLEIVRCPTRREPSGLALSSRNKRLTEDQLIQAAGIYRSLQAIQQELGPGPLGPLKEQAAATLAREGFRVDYVEIATADTLEPVTDWDGARALVALVAAFLGEVRLIDNLLLARPGKHG